MDTHSLDERSLDPAVALAALDESAPRDPQRQFALKHEDCFIVADAHGDVLGAGDGLFINDTRILSLFKLTVDGKSPALLGASLSQDNILFNANLSNRAATGEGATPHGVIHIGRSRFLWQERMYERLAFTNYSGKSVRLQVRLEFAADFRDMFEVRGSRRSKRGQAMDATTRPNSVAYAYTGLDGLERHSSIAFSRNPDRLGAGDAEFSVEVGARATEAIFIQVGAELVEPSRELHRAAAARARFAMRVKRRHGAAVRSSGRVFNDWLTRSRADIALLTTELDTGPYPYAGIPWFSTAFGRDGIISALEMLWVEPRLARGVISFLARHQASETSEFSDSEPGKIMHETRKGEMAVLRELPFGRYYGGVDTTPLFVNLATAYADRTGDMDFVDEIWPSLVSAAEWMEAASARDANGFVTYKRGSGLSNQGWKDSSDSVFHADGSIPKGPIALVEVQGYVFGAYKGLAALAKRRDDAERAEHWAALAERMRAAVEEKFWMEDKSFYAIALDGAGEQCAVRASNTAHLLFVGLPTAERAKLVIEQLFASRFHSGWGIRTLADDELPFNPMSYHNGSIWPHDTALCAAGLSRYSEREAVVKLASDTFEAAVQFQMRLPELFCGFARLPGEAPVAYPVACLPQAWSAGAPYLLLQACLGLHIDGWRSEVSVERPRLPIGIDRLTIAHLQVGSESVDLHFQRVGRRVACYLDERHDGLASLVVRS